MEKQIRLLEEEINKLQREKEEREAALPQHSIRPHQLIAIEELEAEINRNESLLKSLKNDLGKANK